MTILNAHAELNSEKVALEKYKNVFNKYRGDLYFYSIQEKTTVFYPWNTGIETTFSTPTSNPQPSALQRP